MEKGEKERERVCEREGARSTDEGGRMLHDRNLPSSKRQHGWTYGGARVDESFMSNAFDDDIAGVPSSAIWMIAARKLAV